MSEKPLIFKGGTALILFYGLDRISEDLDFDCTYPINIKGIVKSLECLGSIFIKKDTNTVKRIVLTDKSSGSKVKIEISLRNNYVPKYPLEKVQGNLKIYNINDLFLQKLKVFVERTTARDLYDIAFISNSYYSQLDYELKLKLFELLESEDRIYDLIPEYEEVFKSSSIFDEVSLLTSITRLMEFFKKVKRDFRK